jgi:hypothetical protein
MLSDNGANEELEELVRELGLTSAPSDLDALRSEVRARISELHPDHKPVDPTVRLQRLKKVLRKTGKSSTAIQRIEPNSQIARAKAPTALLTREPVEARLDSVMASRQAATSRAFLVPKISLTGLTALLGSAFLFPKTFADHPFVGQLLKGPHAIAVWSLAVLLLAFAWLVVWWMERGKERQVEELHSLTHQRVALTATAMISPEGFSAVKFQDQLYPKYVFYPRWLRRVSKALTGKGLNCHKRVTYDAQMAEMAVELALERFIQRGWIVRVERPEGETAVDDWFKVV